MLHSLLKSRESDAKAFPLFWTAHNTVLTTSTVVLFLTRVLSTHRQVAPDTRLLPRDLKSFTVTQPKDRHIALNMG